MSRIAGSFRCVVVLGVPLLACVGLLLGCMPPAPMGGGVTSPPAAATPTPSPAPLTPTPTPPSRETATLDLSAGVQLVLVKIPGGSFDMGTNDTVYSSNEAARPVHRVTVPTFYIGMYEVTQAQWRAVMGTDPSHFSGDDRPVEQVNWNDAKAFCAALSNTTGYAIRLPSESEWEYACRAGTTTEYYFGDSGPDSDPVDYAWFDGSSDNETHPVGQKTPNAWGLYDMSGNVEEWCDDVWHGDYTGAPTDGSAWTTGGDTLEYVLRGGDFGAYASDCRSAHRVSYAPDTRAGNIGFRVAVGAR